MMACGVSMTTRISDYRYVLGIKLQCQKYLNSVLRVVAQTPLSVFEGGWCVNGNDGFGLPIWHWYELLILLLTEVIHI